MRLRVRSIRLVGRRRAAQAFGVLLGVAAAMPVAGASLVVPPMVAPASAEHHVGKPIFAELITPDLGRAKQLYAGLLGWSFRDFSGGRSPCCWRRLGPRLPGRPDARR